MTLRVVLQNSLGAMSRVKSEKNKINTPLTKIVMSCSLKAKISW